MKVKKLISAALVFCLAFSLCTIGVSADADEVDYSYAYDWLVENGFPEEVLSNLSEQNVIRIFDNYNQCDDIDITYDVAYFDCESESVSTRSIPTSDLEFWIVRGVTGSAGIIQVVDIHAYFEWLVDKPVFFTDGMIVSYDAAILDADTSSFYQEYGDIVPAGSRVLGSTSSIDLVIDGFAAWNIPISEAVGRPYGYADLEFTPNNKNLPVGVNYSSTIYAVYGHRQIAISGVGFSTSGVGIDFTTDVETVTKGTSFSYG